MFEDFSLAFILLCLRTSSVYLFAKADEVKDNKKRRAAQPEELTEEKTTARLLPEGYREPAPSVTDRTTDLLFAEKRGGRKDN